MLDHGAHIDSHLGHDDMPLVIRGYLLHGIIKSTLDLLLDRKIDLNITDRNGKSLLHHIMSDLNLNLFPSKTNVYECIPLIEAGIFNVNLVDHDQKTPLEYAIDKSKPKCLIALLRGGAQFPNQKTIGSLLNYVVGPAMTTKLLHYGLKIDLLDEMLRLQPSLLNSTEYLASGQTILHSVIIHLPFFEDLVKFLIIRGADIEIKNSKRVTPVDYVIRSYSLDPAKVFAEYAILSEESTKKIIESCFSKRQESNKILEIVGLLFRRHPKLISSPIDNHRRTALHIAVIKMFSDIDKIEVVKGLLNIGLDVNALDSSNKTALSYTQDPKLILKLIKVGADKNIRLQDAKILMRIGLTSSEVEIVRFACDAHPALVNQFLTIKAYFKMNSNGFSKTFGPWINEAPICIATQLGCLPIVKELIQRNTPLCNVYYSDSLLEMAIINQKYDVAAFFVVEHPVLLKTHCFKKNLLTLLCSEPSVNVHYITTFCVLASANDNFYHSLIEFRKLLDFVCQKKFTLDSINLKSLKSCYERLLPKVQNEENQKGLTNNSKSFLFEPFLINKIETEWFKKIVKKRGVMMFLWIWKLKVQITIPKEVEDFVKSHWKIH
ncbi:hypothetical protein HK096_003587 [Nowakowskiella sp. JEL0078]|nr:hypothetical protein HK096_003587 [Nowakowskiella sp. JEL0078]